MVMLFYAENSSYFWLNDYFLLLVCSCLRYIVVIINVAGFQTVAIFMQTGDPERSVDAVDAISDVVMDSPNKV